MIGAGPSFSQTLNGPDQGTAVSAEFALDFMFWPTKDVGWYFEPTYSINPRTGERSAAFSIGLLFGFTETLRGKALGRNDCPAWASAARGEAPNDQEPPTCL